MRDPTDFAADLAKWRPTGVWLLLDSSRVGGVETHVATLARGLAAAAVPVEVVFLDDHGPHPMKTALDAAGIPHRTLHGWRDLVARMRRDKPALVHTHGYKAGVLGRLAGWCLEVPMVSTYHAGEPGVGRVRLYNTIDRGTAWLAEPIAVSEAIRRTLPSPAAATLIENFVELAPRPAGGRRPGPVAFVGRLSHEKGPDEFCALAEELPAIGFEVYGDGPLRDALEARHGGRVRFHGAVPSMADRWRDIGLLCMPSRHEGMPMAALEALANGVPVAAYAVGGLPRCIEHGRSGWLAPPGDRARLAAAIEAWRAQGEEAATATAMAAREIVEKRFSREAGTRKVLAVYARALSRRPRPGGAGRALS
jgi:glycosyltransferase involved in cell wall biosynthesis